MSKDLRHLTMFAIMCLVWGLTWIPIRIGVEAIPPVAFAALRFIAAGIVLALLGRIWNCARILGGSLVRIVSSSLLIVTIGYATIFWAAQYVASGIVAIINLSLTPVLLLVLGWLFGIEAITVRKVASIAIGTIGLCVLFYPRTVIDLQPLTLAGMGLTIAGTASINLGYVLSRRLLDRFDPLSLGALQTFIGGVALAILSIVVEKPESNLITTFLTREVFLSWIFLVFGGSAVGFTIYLVLLREWGPSRAGLYAFVSPVIAVASGIIMLGESFGVFDSVGSALMLAAAWVALRTKKVPSAEATADGTNA